MESLRPLDIFLLAINLAVFLIFTIDKVKAKRKQRRIPEKVLLGFAAAGGGAGALLAMVLLRHKIRKWYFWLVGVIGLLVLLALLRYLA